MPGIKERQRGKIHGVDRTPLNVGNLGINSHDDRIDIDHISGDRRDARSANLQALHGHCHDAKTREQGDYLPRSRRAQHQDTEERRARKRAYAVLEQR